MAFQGQIEKLVDKLTVLTQEGKVAWEQTADENIFLASVDWTRLRDLYNMARRKAPDVDEALSDLLSSLGRI
jgi:hypothetical protein